MVIFEKIKRTGMTAVLIGVIGLSLAACGDAPTATPAPVPVPTNTSAPADQPTAAVEPTSMPEATSAPDATSEPAATTGTSDEVQEIQLTIKEWKIEPASVEIKPGKVRFIVTNTGQFSHNVTILQGSDVMGATPTFASSESPMTIELEMTAGEYDMLCSLPGHASQGQRGTITVK